MGNPHTQKSHSRSLAVGLVTILGGVRGNHLTVRRCRLTGVGCSRREALTLLGLLLLAGCGPSPSTPPVAVLPSATSMAAVTPPPATQVAATPTTAPLEGEGLLAWSVAADGAVFVLDATHTLYQLSPDSLVPLAQSDPLIESKEEAAASLLASERYLFVGSSVISQTLVLDRSDFGLVEQLEGFGPLALEPGQRLLMVPLGLEEEWPFGNSEIWAYDLSDLGRSPDRILRHTGASLDDLVIDPTFRRLYVLTSNITASPPHRGQTYEAYSLDTLVKIASVEWERGSLTPPVINPRTGEIVGSRIGLNWTRRLLIADQEGQEVRSRPSVDGQPAIDAAGQWIYLLRRRGLWVLREEDLSLQSILPFVKAPPEDLALSPDGETLYLFGNGWLAALPTRELRNLGLAPVSPLPTAWFLSDPSEHYLQPRVYPSPQMEEDGVAFVQLVSGAENVLETYYSTDSGQSWVLLPSLMEPDLVGAAFLSLSPDFARDRTMTALVGSTLVRSTDGGLNWETWQPRIAFASDRDGNREIYAMTLEGSEVQRLTDTLATEENPAWSPAWTRLAFQSNRSGNWDIFTVHADCDPVGPEAEERCDLRQLTDGLADDLLPAWSPDGRAIAFVSTRDGNPEIYVMDSNGGNQRRLTFNSTGDWRPAWLPDSTHLVFVSDRGGNNDIYQLAVPALDAAPLVSEPEITPVIVSPADDRDPAVAAGPVERLLFLSDRDGFMRTFAADPHSQPRPFAETDQPEAHPATLPGQSYAILVSVERDSAVNIYRASFSEYTALAPSPGFDGQPAGEATGWEPDPAASLAWLQALED
jgi:hypothetical protein